MPASHLGVSFDARFSCKFFVCSGKEHKKGFKTQRMHLERLNVKS